MRWDEKGKAMIITFVQLGATKPGIGLHEAMRALRLILSALVTVQDREVWCEPCRSAWRSRMVSLHRVLPQAGPGPHWIR